MGGRVEEQGKKGALGPCGPCTHCALCEASLHLEKRLADMIGSFRGSRELEC